MTHDISKRQFDKRVKELGFKVSVFGYYQLPKPYQNIEVNIHNAGPRHRDRLAYLLDQLAEAVSERSQRS